MLLTQVDDHRKKRKKLEALINTDKILLQGVLIQALVNLKQQRPDLFILTGQDKIVSLTWLFLDLVTKQ